MKILVSGKGGVGKTTIAALLSIIFSRSGYKVLALDTDSVPNLAQSLGLPYDEACKLTPLVKNEELVAERTGAKPGEGWGKLFTLTPKVDDIIDKYGVRVNENLGLVVVGSIDASKEGCLCPAIALARAFLLHALLKRNEVVIVDSEAGAEVFGRGLAEKFDANITVAEPTLKSLTIARKLVELAQDLGVKNNVVVVNKVKDKLQAASMCSKVLPPDVPYYIVRYSERVVMLENSGKGLNELPPDDPVYHDVTVLFDKLLKLVKR